MRQRYEALGSELMVEARGPVRVVTLNAPERRNSVNDELHDALWRVWYDLADDDEARAVVLTGAGRVFCAGGHYPDLLRYHADPAARRHAVRIAERLARAMIQTDLPIVAAVNGPAIGLGASLAVMSDLVVLADDAYLCDPHVAIGVVAGDGGVVVWPLLMSLLKAKEHLFLGDRIDAAECVRLGLANRVVPQEQVLDEAVALAERLAALPAYALRDTKRALNMHLERAADGMLSFALATERESFGSTDVRHTIEHFYGEAGPA
jgi:enoyl-CoA hydratase